MWRSPASAPPLPGLALSPHAGRPLCSPLPAPLLSHTPPPPLHFLAGVGGPVLGRTGLGPSNGSCSTAPSLHRRETAGVGPWLPSPRGGGGGDGGKGELRAPALLPPPRGGRPCRPGCPEGGRWTGPLPSRSALLAKRLVPRHGPGGFLAFPICSGVGPGRGANGPDIAALLLQRCPRRARGVRAGLLPRAGPSRALRKQLARSPRPSQSPAASAGGLRENVNY